MGTSSLWNIPAAKAASIAVFSNTSGSVQFSGTTGGNHRDGYIVPDVVDQLDIKAGVGDVSINAV